MSQDFFLENRGHQLARLCGSESPQFEIPVAAARGRLPQELQDFFALLERVCLASETGEQAAGEESTGMDEQLRKDLTEFERSVVRLRFSSNEQVKAPAVKLIRAIFADANYFSGLKPLPQYTETFAYELLFPSWLNLLTATMLPQAKNGKPRLEGKRQAVLFEFLGKVNATGNAKENELVGFLTFVASRYDAPLCEELLQRLVELFSKEGSRIVEALDSIELGCKDAKQFARRIRDYLTVKHSLSKWPATSAYPISYKRPAIRVLPKGAASILANLDQSMGDWSSFFRVARPLRALINSEQLLSNEYIEVLESHPRETAELLRLVIQGKGDETHFLEPEGQVCTAKLIELESAKNGINIDRLAPFAVSLAPRLVGCTESMLGYFVRTFIVDEANRKMLLDACKSEPARCKLSEFVVQQAAKSEDDTRYLELLCCSTVISPSDESLSARSAIHAVEAVLQNRSIGNKEFSDLVEDMRQNNADVINYLSNPIMAAAGKSPRLASLYMTLNEISETYAATGKADNFSVIRAKYSALTNFDIGD